MPPPLQIEEQNSRSTLKLLPGGKGITVFVVFFAYNAKPPLRNFNEALRLKPPYGHPWLLYEFLGAVKYIEIIIFSCLLYLKIYFLNFIHVIKSTSSLLNLIYKLFLKYRGKKHIFYFCKA